MLTYAPPAGEEVTQDLADAQMVLARKPGSVGQAAFHFVGRACLASVGIYVFTGEKDFQRILRNSLAGSAMIELFAIGWYAVNQKTK